MAKSVSERVREAACEASDLYVPQMPPHTLTFCVDAAAKKHHVPAASVTLFLAGAGARALWARVENGNDPLPESATQQMLNKVVDDYDRRFFKVLNGGK